MRLLVPLLVVASVAVPAFLAAACRGARLPVPGAEGATTVPTIPSRRQPAADAGRGNRPRSARPETLPTTFDEVRGPRVALRPADLAPVDRWLGRNNAQWIVGDVVDVYASKEYFASMLTMNARVGLVHRSERIVGEDTVSTLTYTGNKGSTDALRAPRVKIGPDEDGLTVTARKTLRVRMARTQDPSRPVQLRIVARGEAAQGRDGRVERRGERLELGGMLRRSRGRWYWVPVQR